MQQLQYTIIRPENAEAFRPYMIADVYSQLWEGNRLAIGAITGQHSCGAVVARVEDNVAYLDSLFVDQAVRRNRFGTMLMQQLLSRLSGSKWVEARYCLEEPELSAVDGFFSAVWGGSPEVQSTMFRLTLEETKSTPFFSRFGLGRYIGRDLCPFESLSEQQLQTLLHHADIPVVLNCFYRTELTRYDLSWAWMRGQEVCGYLLVNEEDEATISLVAYIEKGVSHALFPLLSAVAKGVYDMYPPETVLQLDCIGSVSEGLAKRLLGAQYGAAYTKRQVCILGEANTEMK